MKKLLAIILVVLFFISGCESAPELDIHVDQATSYAINYLNNFSGYDNTKNYELKCYVQSEKESYPQLYRIIEDGNTLFEFIIKPEEDVGVSGILYFTENGKKLIVYPAFETNTALFDKEINQTELNQYLYLEYVTSVDIEGEYKTTDESLFENLKAFAINELPFVSAQKGSEITIYEHLNLIRVKCSSDGKAIVRDESFLYFPVAVNGTISFLLETSTDCTIDKGACASEDDEIWIKAIEQGKPFIIASENQGAMGTGIMITADEDAEFTVPMILKKAYAELKAEAAKQQPIKELFSFTY